MGEEGRKKKLFKHFKAIKIAEVLCENKHVFNYANAFPPT